MKRSRPGGQSHRGAFYVILDVLRLIFPEKLIDFYFFL